MARISFVCVVLYSTLIFVVSCSGCAVSQELNLELVRKVNDHDDTIDHMKMEYSSISSLIKTTAEGELNKVRREPLSEL